MKNKDEMNTENLASGKQHHYTHAITLEKPVKVRNQKRSQRYGFTYENKQINKYGITNCQWSHDDYYCIT